MITKNESETFIPMSKARLLLYSKDKSDTFNPMPNARLLLHSKKILPYGIGLNEQSK